MHYCPRCGAEFYENVASCPECNEALVDEGQWQRIVESREKEASEVFVRVKTVENQFEADVIRDALEKEGIAVLVRSFADTSFNGIYVAQKGWGIIEVPEEHAARARAVVESLG